MAKFKLVTSVTHKFNRSIQVPYAGLITHDENGETEVDVRDEAELKKLLNAVPDLSEVLEKGEYGNNYGGQKDESTGGEDGGKKTEEKAPELKDEKTTETPKEIIQPQVEENSLGKSESDKNDIGKDESEEDKIENDENLKDPIDLLNVQALKDLCKESGFPEEEYKDLVTKKELRSYLKGKLSA